MQNFTLIDGLVFVDRPVFYGGNGRLSKTWKFARSTTKARLKKDDLKEIKLFFNQNDKARGWEERQVIYFVAYNMLTGDVMVTQLFLSNPNPTPLLYPPPPLFSFKYCQNVFTLICWCCHFCMMCGLRQAHIGDIFRSKFTDFQNFHTMLYTCAKEFDFLETEVSCGGHPGNKENLCLTSLRLE